MKKAPAKMKKAAMKMAKKSPAKKKKLTDLSGDNKVTQKDVLIGRGVLPAATKMKKAAAMKLKKEEGAAMKMKKAAMKLKKDSAMMMKKAAMKLKKVSAMKMKMKKK
tara:strand:+ start:428 stop:748 length:321 start_codon:yes stop_codon:yes gene_type:complete